MHVDDKEILAEKTISWLGEMYFKFCSKCYINSANALQLKTP